MALIVVLDSGPLGLLSHSKGLPQATKCNDWLQALLAGGIRVILPEIADYEVRRELLRLGLMRGIRRLERLAAVPGVTYLPITTDSMRQAATYWAAARRQGRPTTDPHALDADVILAAQAASLAAHGDEVVVATTNVGHLARFADAREWPAIAPPA